MNREVTEKYARHIREADQDRQRGAVERIAIANLAREEEGPTTEQFLAALRASRTEGTVDLAEEPPPESAPHVKPGRLELLHKIRLLVQQYQREYGEHSITLHVPQADAPTPPAI